MQADAPPLGALLPLASEAGVYSLPPRHVQALVAAARELEFLVRRIDLGGACGKQAALECIARELAFPSWFGHNWDGLADCLADLAWLGEAAGYVLILEGTQALRLAAQGDYDTLVEILDEAAEGWRGIDRPFWSFLSEGEVGADESACG